MGKVWGGGSARMRERGRAGARDEKREKEGGKRIRTRGIR